MMRPPCRLLPYFQERGLGVINASPLSMGLLTPQVGGQERGGRRAGRGTCLSLCHCHESGMKLLQCVLT